VVLFSSQARAQAGASSAPRRNAEASLTRPGYNPGHAFG
jgi:hypothetical protein